MLRRLSIAAVAPLTLLVAGVSPAHAARIAVLTSNETESAREIIEGFRAELSGSNEYVDFVLGDDEAGRDTVSRMLASKPDLVLSVGTRAAVLSRELIRDVPVVFTRAVDNPAFGLHSSNVTGVNAEIPPDALFSLLRQFDPSLKRIGVVYNPANTGYRVQESLAAANRLGIELFAVKVEVKQDIGRALRGMAGGVDLLWMIRDPMLRDPEAIRELLKFSLIEKVPLLTFSETFAVAGATLAIMPDARGMGEQAGRLAKQLLAGRRPGQITVQSPLAYRIVLNIPVADRIDRLKDLAINVLVYAAETRQSIRVIR